MNITHVEHIGIAVKNLEKSIKFYEEVLGFKCYEIEEVKDQMVRTAFSWWDKQKLSCSNQLTLKDQ